MMEHEETFDINILDVDDLNFDVDRPAWDHLIEKIIEGNVIPVIGPDLLMEGCNIHRKIIDVLAKKLQIKDNPKSFSELVYNRDFLTLVKDKKDVIFDLVNQIFAKNKFSATTILKELLSIRQFPFVITTSFTPIVEDVMKEVRGEDLKVLKFNNNPSTNNDISGGTDMRKPTVYYMFGKVGDTANRYVLTDTNMLDFCSSWLSDSTRRPKNLVNELKNKYLLMLGNSYSDWLFRFIWYSIREKNGPKEGLYACEEVDDELSQFLERNSTFLKENPAEVVREIKTLLAKKIKDNESTRFNSVEQHVDIFISYSRSDAHIAESLYKELSKQGKRVWYDKNNITSGGRFMEEINRGIRSARYFIPIFSKNIEREKNDSHVYRNEWDIAEQVAISLGRKYIIPISEVGFDFYNAAIPERMQQHNAIIFNSIEDIETVAKNICHTMNLER